MFYNQITPIDNGKMKLVNFLDKTGVGFHKIPLLPQSIDTYKNFEGRVLYVPVIHSPPWYFVKYHNESLDIWDNIDNTSFEIMNETQNGMQVIGGREDTLLQLLAEKMNFR